MFSNNCVRKDRRPFFRISAGALLITLASIKVDGYYFEGTHNSKTGEITNSFITVLPRTK